MVNKYRNKKVILDGIEFDSRKEAQRWFELRMLERAGEIKHLCRQVPFELIPSQVETFERYGKKGQRLKDGTRTLEKGCYYVADFVYNEKDGKMVVEDTKGFKTKAYVIKRKLMLERYGIRIQEI